MEKEQINDLLDKYGACATSVEEERELRCYFSSCPDIPPALKPFEAWFRFPEAETLSPLGPDFDREVLAAIRRQQKLRYRAYIRIALIAALLAVLLSAGLLYAVLFGLAGG